MSKFLEFLESIPKKEAQESFKMMYDAYIRDNICGESSHEKRVITHELFRAIEEDINES